jgi:dolichol-phosphate mannosyltransferase
MLKGMDKPRQKILIFIPCYNCAGQIDRVLQGLVPIVEKNSQLQLLMIDNQSRDATVEVARGAVERLGLLGRIWIVRNNENYGLGGSHKVAFSFATKNSFTYLGVFHGDGQGLPIDLEKILNDRVQFPNQSLLGSRFSKGSTLKGYSKIKILGNRALGILYSLILRKNIEDLGSGLNLFYIADFPIERILQFSDDFVFNMDLTCFMAYEKIPTRLCPLTGVQEDQVSNARTFKVGLRTLEVLWKWAFWGERQFRRDSVLRTYSVISAPTAPKTE